MFNEDHNDKVGNPEEKGLDNPNVIKKSLSTIGFCNSRENQSVRPLVLRSTQSFTGTAEELRLCGNLQGLNVCNRVTTIPPLSAVCPCGCLLRPSTVVHFRTRERNSLSLHVVPPNVLNYHGYDFDPCQIAMFWKKDCRMFLWKGKMKKIHQEFNKT